MYITHLSLTNFRNYGRLELDVPRGTILLHGENAQGKTNLLEAIYYMATTRSSQADRDSQLINWDVAGSDEPVVVGRIVASVHTSSGERSIEMRLIQERSRSIRNGQGSFRREVLVNRRKVRLMDLLGNLRVVLFMPQDIQLVTGSPGARRRYIDITLCQIDPIYCRNLSNYNKTLEQRNALLRQIAEGQGSQDLLSVFDERLVQLGGQVFARRAYFLGEIAREAQRIHYEDLTGGIESLRLGYLPRLQDNGTSSEDAEKALVENGLWIREYVQSAERIVERYARSMDEARVTDLSRGTTSIGPHRDDWRCWIGGRNLSSFGSRGQQRSAILALKMAEINWMTEQSGDTPILLLDEVLAELDERRRELLLNYVGKSSQALLTATDPGMFTTDFLQTSATMTVSNGRVTFDD